MKEYTFNSGISIKIRKSPSDVFYAMGETHVTESKFFDLYLGNKFIETYETFDDAKNAGVKITEL